MLQLQRPCFASTRIRAETVVIAQHSATTTSAVSFTSTQNQRIGEFPLKQASRYKVIRTNRPILPQHQVWPRITSLWPRWAQTSACSKSGVFLRLVSIWKIRHEALKLIQGKVKASYSPHWWTLLINHPTSLSTSLLSMCCPPNELQLQEHTKYIKAQHLMLEVCSNPGLLNMVCLSARRVRFTQFIPVLEYKQPSVSIGIIVDRQPVATDA